MELSILHVQKGPGVAEIPPAYLPEHELPGVPATLDALQVLATKAALASLEPTQRGIALTSDNQEKPTLPKREPKEDGGDVQKEIDDFPGKNGDDKKSTVKAKRIITP